MNFYNDTSCDGSVEMTEIVVARAIVVVVEYMWTV